MAENGLCAMTEPTTLAVARNRAAVMAELRRLMPRMEEQRKALPFGLAAIDSHLPDGGLKGRNASAPNGGGIVNRSRPAITTSSRIPAATASGCSAKAFMAARGRRRAGSCTGCLRE
jgi:hypothetical protein